jgi:hypothetical protein
VDDKVRASGVVLPGARFGDITGDDASVVIGFQVDANDGVTAYTQPFGKCPCDETAGTGDEDAHDFSCRVLPLIRPVVRAG